MRLTADQGPQARYTAWLKVLRGHVRVRRRHPGRGLRAGARPRAGRLVGRRRRPARRAARALPARPRRARACGPRRRGGPAQRRVRAQRAAAAVGRGRRRCAPVEATRGACAAGRPAGRRGGRRRRARARRRRRRGPAASGGLARRQGGARTRPGARAGAAARLPARPCPASTAASRRGARAATARWGSTRRWRGPDLPLVRRDLRTDGLRVRRVRRPHRLRSVGRRRAAHRRGAGPGVPRASPVRTSGSGEVLARVGPDAGARHRDARAPSRSRRGATRRPCCSTPGPCSTGSSLDAAVEALRRWLAAAALTRPAADGGVVVLAGAPAHTTLPAVEALRAVGPDVAGEPRARRAGASWPCRRRSPWRRSSAPGRRSEPRWSWPTSAPSSGWARCRSARPGPAPGTPRRLRGRPLVQVLLRAPRADHARLARHLAALRAGRSARKETDAVSVRMDLADEPG